MATFSITSSSVLQSANRQQVARQVFHHRPALILERAVGGNSGADLELWKQAPFNAGIVPDLPVVSSWKQLGAKLLGR